MDVDDDDEYTNAAAPQSVFIMTVSAARMYWLLRYVNVHFRVINNKYSKASTTSRKKSDWAAGCICREGQGGSTPCTQRLTPMHMVKNAMRRSILSRPLMLHFMCGFDSRRS